MPAKPLTPEQRADAERLMILFKKQVGLTQAILADELGFSNQSAVSQYLNGKIPLNIDAAIKFADRFGCTVGDFSPSTQREIDRIAQHSSFRHASDLAPYSVDGWQRYTSSTEEKRTVVDFLLLNEDEPHPGWVDSDARAYADSLEAKARRWLNSKRRRGTKEANT